MEGTTASRASRDWTAAAPAFPWRSVLAIWIKIREVNRRAGSGDQFIFGLWLSLVERLVRDEPRRNIPILAHVLSPAFHR